jgi:hypothetical protein
MIENNEELIVEEEKKNKKVKVFEPKDPLNPNTSWYKEYSLIALQTLHITLEKAYSVQLNTWEIDGLTKERCEYLQGFYERLFSLKIILLSKEKEHVATLSNKEKTN